MSGDAAVVCLSGGQDSTTCLFDALRRYGRVHEMQLDAKPLKQAAQWVEEYRKFWEGSLDRLAAYLQKTKDPSKKR